MIVSELFHRLFFILRVILHTHTHPLFAVLLLQMKYTVRDILTALRPHLKLAKNYEEAKETMDDLQKKLLSKLEPLRPASTKRESSDQLATILEGDSEKEVDEKDKQNIPEESKEEGEGDHEDDEDEDDEETYEYEDGMNMELNIYDYDEHVARVKRFDLEDEAFAEAFDKMVSDDIQDRMRETIKPQHIDISVPYNVRNNLKKNYEQLHSNELIEQEEGQKASVNFVVLLRKGNKQQYKNLEIPLDSDLAKNLKSQEKAERVEMEKVKRLTLDINERLEEEDYYQDQIQSFTQKQLPSSSSTREKNKKRYQHQKGVPDADLIFGKKRVQYK